MTLLVSRSEVNYCLGLFKYNIHILQQDPNNMMIQTNLLKPKCTVTQHT